MDLRKASASPRSINVFYSYAHEDEAFVLELEKQLSVLKRLGIVATWFDREIRAGADWRERIDEHLDSAQVIVLMISADFVASAYCWDNEMITAMQRHTLGTAVVVPIVLRETAFLEKTPFGKLQMLPKDAKPVAQWPRADEVWESVARALGDICIELQSRVLKHEDAAEAHRIYEQIAADAKLQRGERERLISDLRQHIFNAPPATVASRKGGRRPSAMDAYIGSGDGPTLEPHSPGETTGSAADQTVDQPAPGVG
jgi:hypothetical protein